MSKLTTILVVLFISTNNFSYAQSDFLNQAISLALENNATLRQTILELQKSELKLTELRAQKLPTLNFKTRYSLAHGGRTLNVPVGDLLNPVFQNLNLLNGQFDSSGGLFPDYQMLDDAVLSFLRQKEQDTQLMMTLPILNPKLNQAKELQRQRIKMNMEEVALSKEQLSYEVKNAYFNYLKIDQLEQVLRNAEKLIQENLRITDSIEESHQMIFEDIYLMERAIKTVEKKLALVEQKKIIAGAYYNNLLNQSYATPISAVANREIPFLNTLSLDEAIQLAKENRLEIRKMDAANSFANQELQAEKAAYLPQLNLIGKYGVQATSYAFNKKDDYAIGSLVLSWTIFSGNKKHKIANAKINQTIAVQQKESLLNKIELQVIDAFYALKIARKDQSLAATKVENATENYQLIHRKFKQGQTYLTEIIEAWRQLTNAEKEMTLAIYDVWQKALEFEQAIGFKPSDTSLGI